MLDDLFDAFDRHAGANGRPGEARARWQWQFGDGFVKAGIFRGGRGRGGRMFGQGDLRYVVLSLIAEKPRHGYDIIKALEEKFGGTYAPSPGVVYPTLQYLEDLGHVRVLPQEGGKKVYEITDAGRAHLADNRDTVESIFDRIGTLVGNFLDESMGDVHAAFRTLGKATYSRAGSAKDPDLRRRIVDVLARAAAEIEAMAEETKP